jgi:hypothetical protein
MEGEEVNTDMVGTIRETLAAYGETEAYVADRALEALDSLTEVNARLLAEVERLRAHPERIDLSKWSSFTPEQKKRAIEVIGPLPPGEEGEDEPSVPVDATQWHVHKEPWTEGPNRLRDCPDCLALNAAAENAGREVERLRAALDGWWV